MDLTRDDGRVPGAEPDSRRGRGGRRMSASPQPTVPTGRDRPRHAGRVIVVSEWTKLRRCARRAGRCSPRSCSRSACGARLRPSIAHHWAHMSPHERADFHPLEVNLVGVQIAQLAIGVLGVLVITGEYSTGMIRATLTAVPKRLPVLWAKAIVFAAVDVRR